MRSLVGTDAPAAKQVETAFVLALGRQPTPVEQQFCQDHVRAQAELYLARQQPPAQAAEQALASLCSMLLASNEFLYIGWMTAISDARGAAPFECAPSIA